MSKKKHIKAPLTYDPGKGRPKEHLAYLNYQEMQALKRLNGNNMETGPRGLPSFPPADAIGSSSLSKTTTKTTTSTSSPRGNTGSYPSRGTVTSTPKAPANYSSSISGSKGGGASTQRPGSGGNSGAVSRSTVSSAQNKNTAARNASLSGIGGSKSSSSNILGGRTGFSGAGTNTRDAVARQVAASRDATKIARESPAFRGDAVKGGVKSINVGPMGTEVPIGGKVKGAISQVAEAAKKPTQPRDMQGPIPKGISPNEYGWGATGPSLLPSYQLNKIYGGDLAAQGRKFDQKQYDTLLNANTVTDPALNRQVNALSEEMRRNAAVLSSAAKFSGVNPRLAIGMGAAESTLGTHPGMNTGPHRGLMQMGDASWGETANPTSLKLGRENPWASAQAGVEYAKINRDRYVQKLGKEPSLSDIYGMHQQGAAGYISLRQNPSLPAYKVVGLKEVQQNLPKSLQKDAKKITAGQFADRITAYPQRQLAGLTGQPAPSQQASQKQTANTLLKTPSTERYVDPAVAAGRRPERYVAPTTVASDPRSGLPLGAFPAARPVTVMTDPRVGIPPAPNRPNVAANAASLAGKVTSLTRGLFGNQTPAAAPIGPDPFMAAGKRPEAYNPPAQTAKSYDPLSSVKAPSQPTGKVTLEPMETPKMPGAPKGTTTKTDVYTVKKGSIPVEAEQGIADVLSNPGKIAEIAKAGNWGNQDPKALAEIKNDIVKLKEMGVRVENGRIVIPKAAAEKTQAIFNKVAKTYAPWTGGGAPGYGKNFQKGLSKITEKGTVTETKPPSADQLSRYDMNMADYRDAMRGLAMSPSLQKKGDVYAGAVPTEKKIAMSDAGVRKSMPGSGIASPANGSIGPDPFMAAKQPAQRGIAALSPPAVDNYRDPAVVAGKPAERGVAESIYRDPAVVAGKRPDAYNEPYDPLTSINQPSKLAAEPQKTVNKVLDTAAKAIGLNETTKQAALKDYLATGGVNLDPKTTAWCAAFVNATLAKNGLPGTGKLTARSFLDYGTPTTQPKPGDIAVFWRKTPNGWQGHVGFYQGMSPDGKSIRVLGGNQDNSVSEKEYPATQLLGFRKIPAAGAVPASGAVAGYKQDQLPRYVSPEDWQKVVDQNTKNKVGLFGMKRVPIVGPLVSGFDSGKKLVTGKSLAEGSVDLKRAYLQASPAEQLAMRQKYPDMDRFAKSLGAPPLGGNIASGSGSVSPNFPDIGRGGNSSNSGGIYGVDDLVRAASGGSGASGSSGDSGGSASAVSSRPYEYYEWDLGVNIPSPGDAKYNEFQGYLAERAAAQAAMYA